MKNIKAFDLFKNQLLLYTGKVLNILNKNFEITHSINSESLEAKNLFYADENLYIYDGKNIIKHTILSK